MMQTAAVCADSKLKFWWSHFAVMCIGEGKKGLEVLCCWWEEVASSEGLLHQAQNV